MKRFILHADRSSFVKNSLRRTTVTHHPSLLDLMNVISSKEQLQPFHVSKSLELLMKKLPCRKRAPPNYHNPLTEGASLQLSGGHVHVVRVHRRGAGCGIRRAAAATFRLVRLRIEEGHRLQQFPGYGSGSTISRHIFRPLRYRIP